MTYLDLSARIMGYFLSMDDWSYNLVLLDLHKAGQQAARVEHEQLPIDSAHRVIPGPSPEQRVNTEFLANPARYDPANHHRPPPPPTAGVRGPRASPDRVRAAFGGVPQAVETHNLISVRGAPRVVLGAAGPLPDRLPVLLEPGRRPGRTPHLEHRLDPARKAFLSPAGAEDYLHHVARRVALGKLRHGREGRSGSEVRIRIGGFQGNGSPERRRLWVPGVGLLCGIDGVVEALDGVSAAVGVEAVVSRVRAAAVVNDVVRRV
ncbi:mitotic checkpoint serine/threonine-protein kinase BUB1 beta [Striga asiatica]|uniref:Mitotic checkpoint serine/threonine-protein kinase BUB1 beta n=1 Tax=Striga asiatica TaxID=4170 RepID=A0A5A7PDC3_STRAF|nr:mitotic checkpoint serine/threonine-protein kinase BUB1 beta [Striga asiatica]